MALEEVRLEEEGVLPRQHQGQQQHLRDLLPKNKLKNSKKEASFQVWEASSCMGWLLARDLSLHIKPWDLLQEEILTNNKFNNKGKLHKSKSDRTLANKRCKSLPSVWSKVPISENVSNMLIKWKVAKPKTTYFDWSVHFILQYIKLSHFSFLFLM